MRSSTTYQDFHSIREDLLKHPVYESITTPERLHVFMKHHIFAVWDFMSLLKNLQQSLTSLQVPWVPREHPNYTRFINEIVLGEETDEDGEGGYCSHFELYLKAMKEIGADTRPIHQFLESLQTGKDPMEALNHPFIPDTVRNFVKTSLTLALYGKTHEVTAAFFFGREDLIPEMFTVLMKKMNEKGISTKRLQYYLKRHIELDGDSHGPLAEKLLAFVCKDDPKKIQEADEIAQMALQSRINLWNGVLQEIEEKGI